MKQTTFSSMTFNVKKRQTRREKFLAEMEQAVPWAKLVAVVEPHYPSSGRRGRPPMPLEMMIRVYCLQQWYALSDEGIEDALYEVESMRRFADPELIDDAIPDATTVLKFRRRLERHALTSEMMTVINDHLEAHGALLSGGTMVDAALIHGAPSTKNRDKARDPAMHQTKKGKQWYFGLKVHIGADVNSGVVHTASVTAAKVADIKIMPDLLREDNKAVFGDSAYQKKSLKHAARKAGAHWAVSLKGTKERPLTGANKRRNRGLEKNGAQVFMLLGLTNLYLKRKELMA